MALLLWLIIIYKKISFKNVKLELLYELPILFYIAVNSGWMSVGTLEETLLSINLFSSQYHAGQSGYNKH